MTTFTSTLPEDLLTLLNEKAKQLALPKNKLIERALRIYLKQLDKVAYMASYKKMKEDVDLSLLAEEGMEEYFRQIDLE